VCGLQPAGMHGPWPPGFAVGRGIGLAWCLNQDRRALCAHCTTFSSPSCRALVLWEVVQCWQASTSITVPFYNPLTQNLGVLFMGLCTDPDVGCLVLLC
jgi:hypothetical protein